MGFQQIKKCIEKKYNLYMKKGPIKFLNSLIRPRKTLDYKNSKLNLISSTRSRSQISTQYFKEMKPYESI